MTIPLSPYCSPKLEVRVHPMKGGGHGLFAKELVHQDELLVIWDGELVRGTLLSRLPEQEKMLSIQVNDDCYLTTTGEPHPGDFVNHSCQPNAGLIGAISLVALRQINIDEEICFDYAMCDGSTYCEFACRCGAPNCRSHITGNDWQIPELQLRYRGYFSPYLQKRIEEGRFTVREITPMALAVHRFEQDLVEEQQNIFYPAFNGGPIVENRIAPV